jgi:hypothetical protein
MNWRGKEAIMKHILAIVATLAATPAMAQNVIPPAEYDFPYKGAAVPAAPTNVRSWG